MAAVRVFLKLWMRLELLILADDLHKVDSLILCNPILLLKLQQPDQQTVNRRMIDSKHDQLHLQALRDPQEPYNSVHLP